MARWKRVGAVSIMACNDLYFWYLHLGVISYIIPELVRMTSSI